MPPSEPHWDTIKASAVTNLRAYFALAAGVLCISFTAIFTKWASVPGPVSATLRMAIATVVLAIPFAAQRRKSSAPSPRHLIWGVFGGLWFATNLVILNSALLLTSAATATLLDNTAPIWVGLGAVLLFREQLKLRYWAGLVLALGGAAVVTGFSPGSEVRPGPGEVMAFGGAIFYAGYLLNTQRARRSLDTVTYLWLVAATAAVSLCLITLLLGIPLTGYSAKTYWSLLAVGVISQTGGWLLINYALGHLPASTAVVVLLAQPVLTGLFSIPLLGEALTGRQLAGGVLVLTGIYLCVRQSGATAPARVSKWIAQHTGHGTT